MNRARPATPFPDTVAIRVAGRLGMAFFLDVLRIACDGRDLLDGLILLTIGQANTEHLDRAPATTARFARDDDTIADTDLRPISVSALANSLNQPFETIRRRSAALRDRGACALLAKGLIIPAAERASARSKGGVFAINQKVRALHLSFQGLGLLRGGGDADAFDRPRAVSRLAVQYVLRQLEAMSPHIGDPTVGVLLIHVIRATTEHLDDTHTEFTETEDLVRDELRRPASVTLLATRIGLPAETVRRHLAALLAQGWVARGRGGFYLTRDMLRAPPWPQARRNNVVNLNRMFAGLAAS